MITIEGRLPSLNEYISAMNKNRYIGNKMKQEYTNLCCFFAKNGGYRKQFEKPVFIEFYWYEKNKKRDKDNIVFARKFILDGLVKASIIRNDGWAHVHGFADNFAVDKKNPRIEIEIKEVDT